MHFCTIILYFASSSSPAVARESSRIHSRTSTSAACTNAGATVTATLTFAPLLAVHLGTDEECPQSALLDVHYHNENDVGCCTQSAVLTTAADGKLACCGCGTVCTGSVPAVVDWSFSAGQFITTTGTTISPTSPAGTVTSSSSIVTVPTTSPTATLTQPTFSPSTSPTASPTPASASPLNIGYDALIAGLVVGAFGALL